MHHVLRNICLDSLAWLFFDFSLIQATLNLQFLKSVQKFVFCLKNLNQATWNIEFQTVFSISWIWIPWFGENKTDPNLSFDPWMLPLNSGIFDFHSRIFPHALKLWMMPPSRKECYGKKIDSKRRSYYVFLKISRTVCFFLIGGFQISQTWALCDSSDMICLHRRILGWSGGSSLLASPEFVQGGNSIRRCYLFPDGHEFEQPARRKHVFFI